jgi:hypothetical protein
MHAWLSIDVPQLGAFVNTDTPAEYYLSLSRFYLLSHVRATHGAPVGVCSYTHQPWHSGGVLGGTSAAGGAGASRGV